MSDTPHHRPAETPRLTEAELDDTENDLETLGDVFAVRVIRQLRAENAALERERDDRHYVCEAHVQTDLNAECPCCQAVHVDNQRIAADAELSALRASKAQGEGSMNLNATQLDNIAEKLTILRERAESAESRLTTAREALRANQFVFARCNQSPLVRCCPECGGQEPPDWREIVTGEGHRHDCKLALALAAAAGEGGEPT